MNEDINNESADLSDALKNVIKDEKLQDPAMPYYTKPVTPKIIQWTIKFSGERIKDEKQATFALLGLVALLIIISLFLVF